MTSALISILADEGTVDYDVPVKEYVPGFQMADTAASEGLTLRDILCHRSGLEDMMVCGRRSCHRKNFCTGSAGWN